MLFELDVSPCNSPETCFVEFVNTPSLNGTVQPNRLNTALQRKQILHTAYPLVSFKHLVTKQEEFNSLKIIIILLIILKGFEFEKHFNFLMSHSHHKIKIIAFLFVAKKA